MSGNFYKVVAQAVLLFGSETWVLTQSMEKSLESLQSRLERRLTGKQPQRRTDGSWDYSPLVEALGGAGVEGISKLVTRRQNTPAQYLAMRPILELCERATLKPGVRVFWRWW